MFLKFARRACRQKSLRSVLSAVIAMMLTAGFAAAQNSAKKLFLAKTDFRTNMPEQDDWVKNIVELQSKTLFTTYGGMTVVKDKKDADYTLALRIQKTHDKGLYKINGTLTSAADKSESVYKSDIETVDGIAGGKATDALVYKLLSDRGVAEDVLSPINKDSPSYIRNITAEITVDKAGLTFWGVPFGSTLSETDNMMLFGGSERFAVERTSYALSPNGTLYVIRSYKKDNMAAVMGAAVLAQTSIPYQMKMTTYTFINDKMISANYGTIPDTSAYDYMTELINLGALTQSKKDSTGSMDVYYNGRGDKATYDYSSKLVAAYINNYGDIPEYTPPPEELNWDGKELEFMGLKGGNSVAEAEKAVKANGWKNSKSFPDSVQTVSLSDGSAMTTLTKYYVNGKWRDIKLTCIGLIFKNGRLSSVNILPKLSTSQRLKAIAESMVEEYDLHEVSQFVSGGERYVANAQEMKTYRDCIGSRLISYKDSQQSTYVVSIEFLDKEAEAKKEQQSNAPTQEEMDDLKRQLEELKKKLGE